MEGFFPNGLSFTFACWLEIAVFLTFRLRISLPIWRSSFLPSVANSPFIETRASDESCSD